MHVAWLCRTVADDDLALVEVVVVGHASSTTLQCRLRSALKSDSPSGYKTTASPSIRTGGRLEPAGGLHDGREAVGRVVTVLGIAAHPRAFAGLSSRKPSCLISRIEPGPHGRRGGSGWAARFDKAGWRWGFTQHDLQDRTMSGSFNQRRSNGNNSMTFPQSTLEEIIESERQMLLTAQARYGNHYVNARTSSIFLSKCIVSVEHDRMNFGRFFAIMKKHHMLSIMSTVRLHKNVRQ